jgi:hypothetical protein
MCAVASSRFPAVTTAEITLKASDTTRQRTPTERRLPGPTPKCAPVGVCAVEAATMSTRRMISRAIATPSAYRAAWSTLICITAAAVGPVRAYGASEPWQRQRGGGRRSNHKCKPHRTLKHLITCDPSREGHRQAVTRVGRILGLWHRSLSPHDDGVGSRMAGEISGGNSSSKRSRCLSSFAKPFATIRPFVPMTWKYGLTGARHAFR